MFTTLVPTTKRLVASSSASASSRLPSARPSHAAPYPSSSSSTAASAPSWLSFPPAVHSPELAQIPILPTSTAIGPPWSRADTSGANTTDRTVRPRHPTTPRAQPHASGTGPTQRDLGPATLVGEIGGDLFVVREGVEQPESILAIPLHHRPDAGDRGGTRNRDRRRHRAAAHRPGKPPEIPQVGAVVDGQGVGRTPGKRHGPERVEQDAGTRGPVDDRGEELALALHPVQVCACGGTCPDVAEGCGAVQVLAAGLDVESGLSVLDRLGYAHMHTAERIHDIDESAEPDLHVPVDPDPGRPLHGLDEQLWPTEGEGGVQLVPSMVGDGHVRVPGQADQRRLPPARGDVEQHHRVGAPASRAARGELGPLLCRQARSAVGADEQPVLPGGRRRTAVVIGDRIDAVELRIEIEVPADHQDEQHHEKDQQPAPHSATRQSHPAQPGRAAPARGWAGWDSFTGVLIGRGRTRGALRGGVNRAASPVLPVTVGLQILRHVLLTPGAARLGILGRPATRPVGPRFEVSRPRRVLARRWCGDGGLLGLVAPFVASGPALRPVLLVGHHAASLGDLATGALCRSPARGARFVASGGWFMHLSRCRSSTLLLNNHDPSEPGVASPPRSLSMTVRSPTGPRCRSLSGLRTFLRAAMAPSTTSRPGTVTSWSSASSARSPGWPLTSTSSSRMPISGACRPRPMTNRATRVRPKIGVLIAGAFPPPSP